MKCSLISISSSSNVSKPSARKAGDTMTRCFLLLLALFVPNIGKVVNGSLRWIDLGLFNLQPSELAKFGLIIYVSGYCVRRSNQISTILGFVRPLMVVSLFSSAIIFQPDLGSVVIIFCVILSLLFLAGISIGQFSLLVLVLSVLAYIAIRHEPYRYARLISFTDPFAPEFEERSGYQLSNALIGIGRGEFFGVGLGNSIQKNAYLPEPHTDFIFAIILEETGIFGGLALISLFIFLLVLILKISNESQKIGFCPELFIQVNTGNENQKAGVKINELDYILELAKVKHSLPIVGLMCLPPIHDSPLNHFKILYEIAKKHELPRVSMLSLIHI